MIITIIKNALMQTFLIAYLTGILWLKRNPLSLIFSAISPFSLLFILFIISEGRYLPLSITGSLVMALVGYGLSLGQDISFYKNEYKIQDVFVASPVSPITYMIGLAISQILFGLPALLVLIYISYFLLILFHLHSSTSSNYISRMGIDVINGIFSILTYATHA
jgi:ABC-2 type transport system permease protein